MPTALIFGLSGQDGSYLAKFLLNKNYNVFGTTRNIKGASNQILNKLNDGLKKINFNFESYEDCESLIKKVKPQEIYFLIGPSSIAESIKSSSSYLSSHLKKLEMLLSAITKIDNSISILIPSSCEIFQDNKDDSLTEYSNISPRTPYAILKTAYLFLSRFYRDEKGLKIYNPILFNHESTLRNSTFVTKKITDSVLAISGGADLKLTLGNINVIRDWGWAPEFVEGFWLMMHQDKFFELNFATGKSISLREFADIAFSKRGLNYLDHILTDDSLIRANEVISRKADISKLRLALNWYPKIQVEKVIENLLMQKL